MPSKHYKYDPDTLSYKEVHKGVNYYLKRTLFHLSFGAVVSVGLFFAYIYIFDSPKEKRLKREQHELLAQYEQMSQRLSQIEEVLEDIHVRDENIYRVIYEADSIPVSVRKAGFGGLNRYKDIYNLPSSDLIVETAKKLDIVSRQLYVQSKSFDEIIGLVNKNNEMLRRIPAIMPINNKDLTRTASGWGWRIHPVYKIKRFHEGMDFSAPTGTEIYATGDGTVAAAVSSYSGYGKHVKIDHGFGYVSLYAHMSKFNVKVGQKVKRGDIIGYVGSTGISTGPHLHYEVIKKGQKVNPQLYYFQEDLDADDYERMIEISTNSNRTFD
ncbi:MAG: M23 family metallopeptidase [Bacteroidales bacterium]|nr:M23 family metallopeptidase [Bacteroidales bacterium]MDD7725937.1 M23 family metallopeptidase [Bacteroidales bacterium]MDY4174054.1 M23 family metallopeptidase [Bacteroidales bacterium]